MKDLWAIFRHVLAQERRALLRGAALALVVLLMGAALLGLSGWFITAAAAAGLAGAGAVFDVFRPSAAVRFLALGRTAARYGERLLTHDATLRALETLRLALIAGQLRADWGRLVRLRGAQVLNRITADVDALDGVPLRLMLPLGAGLAAIALSAVAVWVLVAPAVAALVAAGYLVALLAVPWWAARAAAAPSRRAERAGQAFRSRLIDLIRARADLAVHGRLPDQATAALRAEARRQDLRATLDAAETRAEAGLSLISTVTAAGALGLGLALAQAGAISPAQAALGFFVALALAEAVAPMRRAVSDLGRMVEAARRVRSGLAAAAPAPVAATPAAAKPAAPLLQVADLALNRPGGGQTLLRGLSFELEPGQVLALTGASGSGKSTLLLSIAGLMPWAAGRIDLAGRPLAAWPEPDLRAAVTLLPQRSALMAGGIAQALRLADPGATDADLWAALRAVQLDRVIAARGGLGARLGPGGVGLSGGEARRLTLARAALRRPRLLLLDEPTEGLDAPTATAVLHGLRALLPCSALLMAAHRAEETAFADRILPLMECRIGGASMLTQVKAGPGGRV